MKKYLCIVCGGEFESDDENPVFQVCGASGADLQEVKEEN